MLAYSAKCVGAILALMLLVAGCSKNENSPTETQPSSPPLPNIVFKGPGSSANDPSLTILRSYVSNVNSFTITLAPLALTTPVQSGSTWTWTYVNKTLTLVLTAAIQSDGTYLWKLMFNGVDPSDGITYDHWLGVDGTTSTDGKTGSGKTYVRNKAQVASEFDWTVTNNVLTGTLKPYINGTPLGRQSLSTTLTILVKSASTPAAFSSTKQYGRRMVRASGGAMMQTAFKPAPELGRDGIVRFCRAAFFISPFLRIF